MQLFCYYKLDFILFLFFVPSEDILFFPPSFFLHTILPCWISTMFLLQICLFFFIVLKLLIFSTVGIGCCLTLFTCQHGWIIYFLIVIQARCHCIGIFVQKYIIFIHFNEDFIVVLNAFWVGLIKGQDHLFKEYISYFTQNSLTFSLILLHYSFWWEKLIYFFY